MFRWQQMYEQMYTELEKVRSMLITEYDMNKELVQEVNFKGYAYIKLLFIFRKQN